MNVDIEAHRGEWEAEQAAKAAEAAAVVAAREAELAKDARKRLYDSNVRRLDGLAEETKKNQDNKLKWMEPVAQVLRVQLGADQVEVQRTVDPVPLSNFLDLEPGEVECEGVAHKVSLFIKGWKVDHLVNESEEWTTTTNRYGLGSKRNGRTRLKVATGYQRHASNGRKVEEVVSIVERKDGSRDWQKLADALLARVEREIAAQKQSMQAAKNKDMVQAIREEFGIKDYSNAVGPSCQQEGHVVISLKNWSTNAISVEGDRAREIIAELVKMGFKPSY